MRLYLDASVVLRIALGQPGALDPNEVAGPAVASELTEIECLRSLDRLRLRGLHSEAQLADRRRLTHRLIEGVEQIALTPTILHRAAAPLPVPLGTLDAIHLASALAWRDWKDEQIALATHDRLLARAARLHGLEVAGG